MPVTKRTTKTVSYNEQDDDDDFMSNASVTKKNRNIESSGPSIESKPSTKQQPRKHEEKLQEIKQEEPKLILERPKKSLEGTTNENPIVIVDQENTSSQSTVSSDESNTTLDKVDEIDDQDENLSPKSKRIKYDEDDDHEEEPTSKSKSIRKTGETIKTTEQPTMSSTDQRNSSTRLSNHPSTKSSVPLGFPTSKIHIPSPHVSRVGLSRKSSTIKPLHSNFTTHILPE